MEIQKKRRIMICILTVVSLLLVVFCILPLLQAQSGTALTLTWQESEHPPELHLTSGETIKGWNKDGIIYFFIPTYVSAEKIILDANLKWKSAQVSHLPLSYDIPQ